MCCLVWVLSQCSAFAPSCRELPVTATRTRWTPTLRAAVLPPAGNDEYDQEASAAAASDQFVTGMMNAHFATIGAGLVVAAGSLFAWVPAAWASTEVEMADLPPPYVPVIFGFAVVAGVGVLTGSLGDVINEEAQLGMQSGARAKKEIERTRSSYFKKK